MRHILFLLFAALTMQAFAQYPATGNKARLGWQTTGDGLVYRGAIGDTTTLDPSGLNNAWMLLDTASGNLYAYRTKAWRLVSGGGGGLTMPFDSVTFNVNETDASLRELKYSEEKGYLQYGGQDSVQIPILPGIWYVRNDTSVTIPKGTVVRASGTLGASGRIKVKHMIANGSIDAMYILGIAMHDIAVGADGYAMSQGKIRQVNTQAYSEGAVLYADVDTLGGLTQTEPGNGFLKLPIAFVVHSASNGVLAVRVTSGAYMRDLHDVEVTSPDSSASLYYNTAQGIWRDTTGAVLTSDTSVFARDFQISGTANYLAKFTGSNAVGNSTVFDTIGRVGIGTTTPGSYLLNLRDSIGFLGNGMYFSSTNGGTANPGGYILGTKLGNWGTRLDIWLRDAGGSLTERAVSITGGGGAGGSIGINTASPSRPLHVAGTTAIRIPSGNFSQRGTSDNGDIRVRTDTASMEYYSGAWRTVAPMARVPQSGLANRFAKFDANGLLDTSAVLTQSGNNIGIGVTPTERLHINGGAKMSKVILYSGVDNIEISNYASAGSVGGNLVMGNGMLSSNDTANNNIAIGLNALLNNTSGAFNTAIGANTLTSNTTGFLNLAVGSGNLNKVTTGRNNVAIGINTTALSANPMTGSFNTFIGSATGRKMESGSYNVFIGHGSGQDFISGNSNIAIGDFSHAFPTATGNEQNIAIGSGSLAYIAGNLNVAIGSGSGQFTNAGNVLASASKNVFIGNDTRALAVGDTNEIVIGYQGRGNGSNTTTIGNSSTTATILPAGRLGIAITSPTARLHLPAGTASANTAPLKFTSGTNLTTPEAGAVEWNGTNVFVTNSSATRQTVNQGLTGSATMDFPNTDAQKSSDLTITVTGASDGDVVSLGVPNASVNANTCYTAWVSAVNTVTIRFNNYSTGAINPASATFKVFVTKF